jgi:hypothetical protein
VIKKPRKNEEAKARYRAVENTTRWVVTPGKRTTNKLIKCRNLLAHAVNDFFPENN